MLCSLRLEAGQGRRQLIRGKKDSCDSTREQVKAGGREGGRDTARESEGERERTSERVCVRVCEVCMCVCVRERERGRGEYLCVRERVPSP